MPSALPKHALRAGIAFPRERLPLRAGPREALGLDWPHVTNLRSRCGVIPTDKQATPEGNPPMFSSTLKRSAAALGVVAGLLAAAAPASAQFLPTGTGVTAPANADHQRKDKAVVVLIGANDYGWTDGNDQPTRSCDFC
jgi:hypothetical protein